jgi:hypothetical protein
MAVKGKSKTKKKQDKIKGRICITPKFRVAFPHVFEKHQFEDQEPKYSLVALIKKSVDLAAPAAKGSVSLKKAIHNAKVEKWGPDKSNWPKNLHNPIRDGSDKSDLDGYEGCIFFSMSSKKKVEVIDKDGDPIESPEEFYGGCYARAQIIASAFDRGVKKGVTLTVTAIQKLADGESFGGKTDAREAFGLESSEDEDDEQDDESDDEESDSDDEESEDDADEEGDDEDSEEDEDESEDDDEAEESEEDEDEEPRKRKKVVKKSSKKRR